MPDLRFSDLSAREIGRLDEYLKEAFGFSAVVKNDEWLIPARDPKLKEGPPDVIVMHPRIELSQGQFRDVAQRMLDAIPTAHEEALKTAARELPSELTFVSGFGLHSKVHQALTMTVVLSGEKLTHHLETKLLPLMLNELGYRYVVPITALAEDQQKYATLAKAMVLLRRSGSTSLKRLLIERKAARGIELSGFDLLGIVDGLTRLAPVAFTLPVNRAGCAWHFYTDGFRSYPLIANRGLFGEFISQVNPRTEGIHRVLTGAGSMGESNIWRLLREAVFCTNRLMSHLNNLVTFADSNGAIDFLTQLRAYGALKLLIADLLALTHTTVEHDRIGSAIAFMDKLASLRMHLGNVPLNETEQFKGLASLSQGKELKRLMIQDVYPVHPDLAKSLTPVIGAAYGGLHRHLGRELPVNQRFESRRLQRLRNFRNMHHGTFLSRGAFEELFLDAEGTVPHELITLPFVLMLGLGSNPAEFLSFQPVVTK